MLGEVVVVVVGFIGNIINRGRWNEVRGGDWKLGEYRKG
jgi:hypothetical protein